MQSWTLQRDDVALAILTRTDLDWPWMHCTFRPTPAFEEFRSFFQISLDLSTRFATTNNNGDYQAWESAYQTIIDLRLVLIEDDGTFIDEFLLYVDDDKAWFRY